MTSQCSEVGQIRKWFDLVPYKSPPCYTPTYDINHKNDSPEPNFLVVKKTFGTDIASIFFSYFPHKGGTQIKINWVLPFFYPISIFVRNIVGGVSNIPKRYPTIINAHANKKIRVKVLVIETKFRGWEIFMPLNLTV